MKKNIKLITKVLSIVLILAIIANVVINAIKGDDIFGWIVALILIVAWCINDVQQAKIDKQLKDIINEYRKVFGIKPIDDEKENSTIN